MSATVDTNVLVYASDRASARNAQAREVVEQLARGPDLLHLFWPVLMGYLRIVTHPAVFEAPLPIEVATANVEALLGRPHVRALGENDGFWAAYCSVTAATPARGNLVSDAHLVALMRQHGVTTIWTHDRDFRKFDGIKILDPFQ